LSAFLQHSEPLQNKFHSLGGFLLLAEILRRIPDKSLKFPDIKSKYKDKELILDSKKMEEILEKEKTRDPNTNVIKDVSEQLFEEVERRKKLLLESKEEEKEESKKKKKC